MGATASGISDALRKRPFVFIFGAMIVASAVLMLHYRSKLGFMLDDWAFVIYRADGDAGDFLDPHNEHISILPIAIYKLFLGLFGMTSAMPLHLLSVAAFLASVVILFLYMRPLVGEPAAVLGCGVVLFLGTAWEDLLWAFQIGFSISIGCGIGALIMLRRDDSFGDRIACLLLTVSMISTSMGIPFAVGAFVAIALRRRDLLRTFYVVAVPLAVYAVWWLGWGHTAESALSLHNAVGAPEYIFNAFRLALANVTGAFRVGDGIESLFTALLTLAVVGYTAWSLYSRRTLPKAFLIGAAVALAFWGLSALNLAPGRGYMASRYQFPGAVFLLMTLAGAFEGVRIRPRVLAGIAAVALFAIVVNTLALRDGYWGVFKPLSDKGVAGLTALDLAREDSVDPTVLIGMNADDSAVVAAGGYYDAEDRYGPAGWSESEIAGESPAARQRVDQISVLALPVSNRVVPRLGQGGECVNLQASPDGNQNFPAPSRTFSYRPSEDTILTLGRFADGTPTGAGITEAGQASLVTIPPDDSDVPWRIGFIGEGKVRVCSSRG